MMQFTLTCENTISIKSYGKNRYMLKIVRGSYMLEIIIISLFIGVMSAIKEQRNES